MMLSPSSVDVKDVYMAIVSYLLYYCKVLPMSYIIDQRTKAELMATFCGHSDSFVTMYEL